MAERPDYKKTVNLPKTDFPMKGNLPVREPEMLRRWEAERTYEAMLQKNAGNEPFVLTDGPPYANNHIHQGHMLNKILKDFVVKFRSMEGRYVDFVPGWDCHGLPIELQVDKQLGKRKREMSQNEIRDACRAYAEEWVGIQREEFKRLGIFGHWERPYLTMSYAYEAATVREFGRFAAQGSLYRGKKPVYWCIFDRTALAEAEVEYHEHESPSIWVGMDLVSELPKLAGEKARLVIWTTTPWTLPANLAIAVHPEVDYVAYRLANGQVVVVARALLASFLSQVAPEELREGADLEGALAEVLQRPDAVLAHFTGAELEGLRYRHPFLERESPVVLGEHVTLEQGTGLVHTAPGHGQEDYEVGLAYGLEVLNPVDDAGRFTEEAGEGLVGQRVFDANAVIVEGLAESGHLLAHVGLKHSYPHCWRCSRPVIFRATDQWFVSMEANELREKALAEVDRVQWIPKWGRDRIHGMIENRPDWCISRQRVWGTPIPVLYCEGCDEALLDGEVIEKAAQWIEKEGGNAWFARPASDFLPEGKRCAKCGGESFRKEKDILDVWFDSGVVFTATRDEDAEPADLYLEGSDQHRGWFHSSLLCSVATRDRAPYRAVLTHGFVVDGEGRKISKKLGNYVDPAKLIGQYGAELMRMWVATEDYRSDLRSSEAHFRQLGEGYFRLRNTLRYGLSNLHDFDPAKDAVSLADLPPLEAWVHDRLGALLGRARKAYADYDFHLVLRGVLEFCVNDVSAILADIRKDSLYCDLPTGPQRRATQTVLYAVVRDLCRLLAPILSFTSEEAWSHLPGEKESSVFLAGLPEPWEADAARAERFERLFSWRSAVSRELERARKDKRIGKSLEAKVVLGADGPLLEALQEEAGDLATLFIVSQVEIEAGGQRGTEGEEIEGLWIQVEPASGEKCVRCWNFREDLGSDPAHPELCARCTEVVQALAAD